MNVYHRVLWSGLLFACALPVPGRADTTASVRKTLAADYAKEDAAAEHKDAKALFADCAPNCVMVEKDGRSVSLADDMAQVQQLFRVAGKIGSKETLTKVTLSGGQAVALVTANLQFRLRGGDGKLHTLTDHQTTKDTWLKVKGTWMRVKSVVLTDKPLMDGKPAPGAP